eukprot:TRINITY_DN4656_c0_g1_i1.p1 TRINITY_DN4656_c0_g1~~TRINITY_DN4656_c0_g1_i1.p1  ORF type:complete len:393 (-),score=58.09 TRINITY_DN4656_c0_g1_i1:241-1419(-)
MVQAWSLSQPEWTCKIDEGHAGIAYARWSPDSRHILTVSDFQLRLTVWSLLNTACIHVQWPKHGSKGVSFTQDGKFAAIAIRKDCKDYVSLLSCHSWEVMGTFSVDTIDLADLEWSPNDSGLVVWDSPLDYKVLIYSPDGRRLFKYQAYEHGLGVKTLAWSPCGQFLAVGSYDQMLRTLNHLTWKPFAEFVHPSTLRGPTNTTVFKEVEEPLLFDTSEFYLNEGGSSDIQDGNPENTAEGHCGVRYKVVEFPLNIASQKPHMDKPNPKQGIGLLSWSKDSQFLFSRNDNMPTALWIWDICRLELAALLIQKEPIRNAAWDPLYPRVAFCTGSSVLYMWTPSGAFCVKIPVPQFAINDLKWSADGTCLLLKDRDSFCCTFVPSPYDSDVEDTS